MDKDGTAFTEVDEDTFDEEKYLILLDADWIDLPQCRIVLEEKKRQGRYIPLPPESTKPHIVCRVLRFALLENGMVSIRINKDWSILHNGPFTAGLPYTTLEVKEDDRSDTTPNDRG